MRKLIFAFLMFVALTLNAQNFGAVRFMGIPVDGTKEEMITQLEKKGFKYDIESDNLKGKFNGGDANVFIHTNQGVVDRVIVQFANYVSETDIKINFNNLVRQFNNNERYSPTIEDQYIPEDDDISYEIHVNNKRYQATYKQQLSEKDVAELHDFISDNFEKLFKKDENAVLEDGLSDEERKEDVIKTTIAVMKITYYIQNDVWFMISESPTKYNYYSICIFYDNLNNKPNGEDL